MYCMHQHLHVSGEPIHRRQTLWLHLKVMAMQRACNEHRRCALVQNVRKIFFFSLPVDLYLRLGRSPEPICRSRKFIRMKTHAKATAEEDTKVCTRSKVVIYWCGCGGRSREPMQLKNGNLVLAMQRHKHTYAKNCESNCCILWRNYLI